MRLAEFLATQDDPRDDYHTCSICRLLAQLTDDDRADFTGGLERHVRVTTLHGWLVSRAAEEGLWCPKIGVTQKHVREKHPGVPA